MLQAKKLNASMIAVVVLSVLLAIAVSFGATMAWFASADSAKGVIGTSGPVEISLTTGVSGAAGSKQLDKFQSDLLVPSEPVSFDIRAEVTETLGTSYLVRAKFDLTDQLGFSNEEDIRTEFENWLKLNETNWALGADNWYYLKADTGFVQDPVAAEAVREITVLVGDKNVPYYWTNAHANAKFDIELTVQATQSEVYEIVSGTGDDAVYGDVMATDSVENLKLIFDQVFGTHANPAE